MREKRLGLKAVLKRDECLVPEAIGTKAFTTVFQPIVETGMERKVGFEALYRGQKGTPWEDPSMIFKNKSCLTDDELYQMDIASMESAVINGKQLPAEYKIFINVMPGILMKLVEEITYFMIFLERLEVSPKRIVLEMSECTSKQYVGAISSNIYKLRSHGVRIALDDVGVNYAGLDHMLRLEPDFIKVDRFFISGMNSDYKKKVIVEGLAKMSNKMGIDIIGEGIEHEKDYETLKELGVPLAQGFLFGHPEPVDKWKKETDHEPDAEKNCKGGRHV